MHAKIINNYVDSSDVSDNDSEVFLLISCFIGHDMELGFRTFP